MKLESVLCAVAFWCELFVIKTSAITIVLRKLRSFIRESARISFGKF